MIQPSPTCLARTLKLSELTNLNQVLQELPYLSINAAPEWMLGMEKRGPCHHTVTAASYMALAKVGEMGEGINKIFFTHGKSTSMLMLSVQCSHFQTATLLVEESYITQVSSSAKK